MDINSPYDNWIDNKSRLLPNNIATPSFTPFAACNHPPSQYRSASALQKIYVGNNASIDEKNVSNFTRTIYLEFYMYIYIELFPPPSLGITTPCNDAATLADGIRRVMGIFRTLETIDFSSLLMVTKSIFALVSLSLYIMNDTRIGVVIIV